MTVRILAITKPGLTAMTLSVGLLWSCLGAEAAVRHQAIRDTAVSLRTLAELRHSRGESADPVPVKNFTPQVQTDRPISS